MIYLSPRVSTRVISYLPSSYSPSLSLSSILSLCCPPSFLNGWEGTSGKEQEQSPTAEFGCRIRLENCPLRSLSLSSSLSPFRSRLATGTAQEPSPPALDIGLSRSLFLSFGCHILFISSLLSSLSLARCLSLSLLLCLCRFLYSPLAMSFFGASLSLCLLHLCLSLPLSLLLSLLSPLSPSFILCLALCLNITYAMPLSV